MGPVGAREGARGQRKGSDTFQGPRARGRGSPSAHGHSSSASAVLDFPIPVRFDETFWARTAVSMHETHMTQRDPDFNEQSGNAHPYVHPSLPLVSPNSLYALSNLRQSSQLIFSRWGIQGNQSAGYPEGTRSLPKGTRRLLEGTRRMHGSCI